MEKTDITSSSKLDKKKKSKIHAEKYGGSSEQDAFLHEEPDVKPRRSFWRNLFRRQPKKTEAPDQKNAIISSSRLNAIFEEPKSPEEKDQSSEDIEAIKESNVNSDTEINEPQLQGQDDGLIDFLSDTSSSNSSTSMSAATQLKLEPETTPIEDTVIVQVEHVHQVPDDKPETEEPRKDSALKDGYSFEYSETSEPSAEQSEEKLDDKQENKVLTFDEKVEQKDADSNIVVKDLNIGEIEPEVVDITIPEMPVIEELDTIDEVSHDEQETEIETDENTDNQTQPEDCRRLDPLLSTTPAPVARQLDSIQPLRYHDDILLATGTSYQADVLNKFSTHSTQTKPAVLKQVTLDDELDVEDEEIIDDEHELWNIKLNELTGLTKSVLPASVDINSLDENDAGYREYRLDDFFKMIFRQTNDDNVLNYSVAYDPIFTNYNIHCYQPEKDLSFKSPDEKQKVVRKRKMMSLLNDKNKMVEYLREIEQEQLLNAEKAIKSTEELIHDANKVPQNSPITKSNTSQNISNNENILNVLETTKQKLQTYIQDNICPENYLEIFKFINKNDIQKCDSLNNLKTIKKSYQNLNLSKSDTKTVQIENFPTYEKINEFRNVDIEIDNIFQELMTNVTELKESCILQGAEYNETEDSEPLITITPLESSEEIVSPIVDDILGSVFDTIERKNDFPGSFGAPTFSFVKEFGHIISEPPTVTINTGNDNFYSNLSLDDSLQRSELFLTEIKDELSDFNPISYLANINLDYFENLEENNYIHIQNNECINSNYIPRTCCNTDEDDANNNSNNIETNSNSNIIEQNSVLETAQNLVETIQDTINIKEIDKSKKFGPYYSRKPGESKEQMPKTTINNLPEVTESLQHIFFGDNSDNQILSEFNLVEDNLNFPQAGPSNNVNNTTKSLNKLIDNDNLLETILESRISELTNISSDTEEIPLELINLDQYSNSNNSQLKQQNLTLERKMPDTNLHNHFPNLDPDEINKSIQENLKKLKEKCTKIKKTNEKTVEMLTSSTYSTPEGSLSILSTITENLENISRSSQERYPQYLSNSSLNKDKPQEKK